MPKPQPFPCPYLGVQEDPQTCLSYPSPWNVCHHAKPVTVVRLSHQRSVCLAAAHVECPVFQTRRGSPLPAGLRRG